MDFSSLTIGFILVVICILPILLFKLSIYKKRQKSILNLIQKAAENRASIHDKNLWNTSIIGLDKTNKILFFSKKSEEFDTFISINVSDLLHCEIKRIENNNILEILALELTFANKPSLVLEFFNKKETRLIINEIEIITKWQSVLHTII